MSIPWKILSELKTLHRNVQNDISYGRSSTKKYRKTVHQVTRNQNR